MQNFPKDVYEQLLDAYDHADTQAIEAAGKLLETTIKKMAKDISDKYLAPPATTDFGIMFLPFEGIYAEVVRRSSLLEELQRNYKVVVTGPTTLAAILNSLQMGFRTLAIQKHSGEVWTILGAVKKEFEKVGGMLEKAQKELQAYALQVKDELTARQQSSRELFTKQMDSLGQRPEPAVWNAAWKEKLEAKEKEMKDQKEAILADIRDKAADVAEEQGIDIIFSEYEGIGTALDVTDDIIVKLA